MWWRCTRREFEKQQGEGNRQAMQALVNTGEIPGILGYAEGEAVGWCSVAPREQYGSLERSPVLKRLDNVAVWSLVCLFVRKDYRNKGMSEVLIRGAVAHVARQGGKIVEAYPTLPKKRRLPPVSSYMGVPAMFEQVGFVECARPSKSRAIVRYFITKR